MVSERLKQVIETPPLLVCDSYCRAVTHNFVATLSPVLWLRESGGETLATTHIAARGHSQRTQTLKVSILLVLVVHIGLGVSKLVLRSAELHGLMPRYYYLFIELTY